MEGLGILIHAFFICPPPFLAERSKGLESMDALRSIESGPSRRLSRTITAGNLPDFMDPEVVPSSLAQIAPILRVANEIEEEAPRVAYLCKLPHVNCRRGLPYALSLLSSPNSL
jgi:hypothetical protein